MPAADLFSGRVRVRSAALVLKSDSVLLVRQHVPTRSGPVWLPPGGGVEPGETGSAALAREVAEETRIQIKTGVLRYIHEFIEPPYHAVELYYLVDSFSGMPEKGFDPELSATGQQILEVRFVPFSDLDNLELYPEFLKPELLTGRVASGEGIFHFKTPKSLS